MELEHWKDLLGLFCGRYLGDAKVQPEMRTADSENKPGEGFRWWLTSADSPLLNMEKE